jgi:hypothetical protein
LPADSGSARRIDPGLDPRSNPRLNPRPNPGAASTPPAKEAEETGETVELQASFEPGYLGPRLAPPPGTEAVRLPPVSDVQCHNTTRLLPAKYSESVLTRIAGSDTDLQLVFALDNATNDRLLAETNLRLGITARELVFDVPYSRIVNAAFTHPHPLGARFSMPYRGAWYAGLELATAKAEVLFHRAVQFAEIGWQQPEDLEYDQYTADFSGCFHDLRPEAFAGAGLRHACQPLGGPGFDRPGAPGRGPGLPAGREGQPAAAGPGVASEIQAAALPPAAAEFAGCLALDSYISSQQLAIHLLEAGSLGILYPSARRAGGHCIACFRPSLVANVRKRDLYRLRWYPDRPATFVRSARAVTTAEAAAGSVRS